MASWVSAPWQRAPSEKHSANESGWKKRTQGGQMSNDMRRKGKDPWEGRGLDSDSWGGARRGGPGPVTVPHFLLSSAHHHIPPTSHDPFIGMVFIICSALPAAGAISVRLTALRSPTGIRPRATLTTLLIIHLQCCSKCVHALLTHLPGGFTQRHSCRAAAYGWMVPVSELGLSPWWRATQP